MQFSSLELSYYLDMQLSPNSSICRTCDHFDTEDCQKHWDFLLHSRHEDSISFPEPSAERTLGVHCIAGKKLRGLRGPGQTPKHLQLLLLSSFLTSTPICILQRSFSISLPTFISFKMVLLCLEICIKNKHLSSPKALRTKDTLHTANKHVCIRER